MEDTQKMIERYKRELMELMKSTRSPGGDPSRGGDPNRDSVPIRDGSSIQDGLPKYEQPAPETDFSPMTPVQPSPQPPQAEMEYPDEMVKQPKVIGYVEDDVQVPDEYGKLISEITDNDVESEEENERIADTITEDTDESTEQIEPEMDVPRQREPAIGDNPTDEERARGSRGAPIEYPESKYDNYEQFIRRNIGRGTIVFRVYTAREALPLRGARCILSKRIAGSTHEIASMLTNESGQTPPQSLPAPSKELSQKPENNIQPFALYDATVKKDGYADVILRNIPIFDGVQSIQRVAMIPDEGENKSERITEVPDANE